jgi:hypothetical protein
MSDPTLGSQTSSTPASAKAADRQVASRNAMRVRNEWIQLRRDKPIFVCLGDVYSASKAGAMIDPRKSFGIFGSRREMAAGMKKLLCNFYMHVGECNQSNRKRFTSKWAQTSRSVSTRLSAPRCPRASLLRESNRSCAVRTSTSRMLGDRSPYLLNCDLLSAVVCVFTWS